MSIAKLLFMAPTALMVSGQRSRSSKMYGRNFSRLETYAAQAVKNCGDVPTMTSTLRMKRLAMVAETM